ncbi:MAG: hypothetical protein ACRDOO_24850 [Actinomadura sp.]
MVDDDDPVQARLCADYGDGWSIGRTLADDVPHWWMATRKRRLTIREVCRGLSMTVIGDTAADLRAALDAEAEREAGITGWNPAGR